MKSVKILEGETEVLVPEHEKGPGPRGTDLPIFYNPAMERNRDISISFLRAWGVDGKRLLDGMAASGVRGVRMENELDTGEVVLTDVSRESVKLIKKNISLNDADAEVFNESLESHLLNNRCRYDYVDLDPFGTPVPFLPTVLRYTARNGVVGLSATDTSVLCGTYPKKCLRSYSARPKNNWCRHENGLRILLGHIVREAARYDRGAVPLLSYYDGHHFRVYVELEAGARKADKALQKLGCYDFGEFDWKDGTSVGPLWTGMLFSEKILNGMKPVGTMEDELIERWKDECSMPPFFYDNSIISKHLKLPPPPLDHIITELRGLGYKAVKTHFSPTAFKTDAPSSMVLETFNSYPSAP